MPSCRRSTFTLIILAAALLVAVACGGSEPAEPPTPESPARAADPASPATTGSPTVVPNTPRPANTPMPARPAAEPRPRPAAQPLDLHDSQVVTAPGRMRSEMAPWRDGGGNRLFSTHVFGTPFMLDENGQPIPWIATAITSDEDMIVWTMKLREDAVFQDGTPITAADFKAYWEHGAKPENIVAWGGASRTLEDIKGWEEVRAEGLRVIDDHTLEMELSIPNVIWPLHMAAWHVGISKLEQVETDDNWGNGPIGAGPFSLTYDPESGMTELTRVDLIGGHWNGPHDTPIIEKLILPNVEDKQARLIMFENGELDLMAVYPETYAAVLDPGHPFNPLLYVSPYGGLWYIKPRLYDEPVDDFHFRKALAHGQDMESIVSAVWGSTATHAKGLISSHIPCHDPDADYQPYDPDLARQYLSESTYGSAADVPPLLIDLRRPDMVEMGVAVKEYWKDNLDVELDILKLENGMLRRATQIYRTSFGSWIPDPSHIVRNVVDSLALRDYYWPHDHPVVTALFEHAWSLPLDAPGRCEAFQAIEAEFLDKKVYIIPIREVDGARWVVHPWLRGFQSTCNLDFNTLTTAYVAKH